MLSPTCKLLGNRIYSHCYIAVQQKTINSGIKRHLPLEINIKLDRIGILTIRIHFCYLVGCPNLIFYGKLPSSSSNLRNGANEKFCYYLFSDLFGHRHLIDPP